MLISKKKGFLFFHVYKVAGTSIRNALIPFCGKKQVTLQNIHYLFSICGIQLPMPAVYRFHPRLADVRDAMGDDFYKLYRFCFVRNPLDWQKSLFFFTKQNLRHHQHKIVRDMNFEEYINWRINNDLHLMSDLLSDSNGRILVDDIYRFEEIDKSFKHLCNKLEIKAKLPHKNIAGKGRVVDLSDATLLRFKDAYEKDYLAFGYD